MYPRAGSAGSVFQFNNAGGTGNVLNITNSTISNNSVAGNNQANAGTINLLAGTGTIVNSTFTGNTASAYSAIGFFGSVLNIYNSTFTANNSTFTFANTGFGGAVSSVGGTSVVNMFSTIVSGNFSANARPDLTTNGGSITASNCLIGSSGGATSFTFDAATTALLGQAALLNPLADNGGALQGAGAGTAGLTMSLQSIQNGDAADSPALNVGSNPLNLMTDQRGGFFVRAFPAGQPDIGAFEDQPAVPAVTGFTVNDGLGAAYALQRSRLTEITLNFASAVDASLLQTVGAITLTRTAATNTGTVGTVVNTSNGLIVSQGSATSLILTFANITSAGINNGSLADGRWQLAVGPGELHQHRRRSIAPPPLR